MSRTEVTLIDYGVGNLFSVERALEYCGAKVTTTSAPDVVRHAPKLLLPGVGAFGKGIGQLMEKGLDLAIKEAVGRGSRLLGVCLGMQLLLDSSDEFGIGRGLGLIPGKVVEIPDRKADGSLLKIPHMGWSELIVPAAREGWEGTLLQTTAVGTSMYFVHSYMACPEDPKHRLADCIYGETRIAAMIERDNVWGTQFHPEKSGDAGLNVLHRFMEHA